MATNQPRPSDDSGRECFCEPYLFMGAATQQRKGRAPAASLIDFLVKIRII
jgi:hypothetical protein